MVNDYVGLHCPHCYDILRGNTREMSRRATEKPCLVCGQITKYEEYLTTAQAVRKLGMLLLPLSLVSASLGES